jgi:hypothetical protein
LVSGHRTHPTITRRGLLAAGGAAGATAFVALNPRVASAVTAIGQDPAHLRRSGYARLVGQDFNAGGWSGSARLTLAEVADIGGMTGRDDAFSLRFVGPTGIASGTHTLSHPGLGTFQLMVTPTGPPGRTQDYEAVVDRSQGLTRRAAPQPPKRPSAPVGSSSSRKLVRDVKLRRTDKGLRCEIVLADRVHARKAFAWLMRDGTPIAVSGSRAVRKHRVVLRLNRGRRLRRGRYELVVGAGSRLERLEVKLR